MTGWTSSLLIAATVALVASAATLALLPARASEQAPPTTQPMPTGKARHPEALDGPPMELTPTVRRHDDKTLTAA